ncbi:NnrU family protein [Azospirillum picis]|uniref:Membrane protein n=1 Tax=Azospirillum picis TaxID=488438 RepID=A0ABU0MKM3_9PROT|nr:NnrU family protein [Azospirillum picis]MBP2300259.1 putative membrane protein [Azospirillum picis]MDQ0533899.1 putative membrane protein [Azospirillum picis]
MTMSLALSAALLFLSHAVPSWPGVRPALIARLGRGGFATLHSAGSLATLALFILAYRAADGGEIVFTPAGWAAPLVVAVMPLVLVLLVARVTTRFGSQDAPNPPCGIYRLTRAPGSLALLLWAMAHLNATGDGRRVLLFATMAAIALFALVKNEVVLRRSPGGRAYRAETALLPFTAPQGLRGGMRGLAEMGAARLAGGLAAYGAMLLLHPWLFGVDPLYWIG